MNVALRLASEFIERAANPAYGVEVNEEYAFRWMLLRQTGDPVRDLQIPELSAEDSDALSPEAWFWLGSNLRSGDPELPFDLTEALFMITADPIYRLCIADMSLRHPALAERYSLPSRPLAELPPTWARNRLLDLISREESAGDGLTEMTALLLQVGNKPSLRLLGGLRRERRSVVDATISGLAGAPEGNLDDLVDRLGLADL